MTNKNKHLEEVLYSHKITHEQRLLDKHKSKREEIVTALKDHYGNKLYQPFNSGSYIKNTAVNTKFDFDLMAPFKRDAFETLEEMFNNVFNFLYERYKNVANVRRQKVSIGIEFYADEDGDIVKIDVVPGRELNQDQYKEDNKLNLFVYNEYGKFLKGSERLRTNVKAQIENVRSKVDKSAIRQKTRLLKVWKIYNRKTPKSFFLELITIKAFESKEIEGDLWGRLKSVIEFIRDNVKNISLPDPGNSNNDVADTLTDGEKAALSDDMKYMLERIEENSDYIETYFPINPKYPFPQEKKEDAKYGIKEKGISIPPATRFG